MTKIKMLTKYRHFFEEGDVVEVNSPAGTGQVSPAKAEQLVDLDRAEWVDSTSAQVEEQDNEEPNMDWLKKDLQLHAEKLDLPTYGTKTEILERIRKAEE